MVKEKSRNLILLTLAVMGGLIFYKTLLRKPTTVVRSNAVPSNLIGDFKSMASVESIKSHLNKQTVIWSLVGEYKLPPDDKRPRFETKTIKINGYYHENTVGVLILEFYNDRLMETLFYPENMAKYKQIIETKLDIQISENPTNIGGDTYVQLGNGSNGKQFIRWADIRLTEEMISWINTNS